MLVRLVNFLCVAIIGMTVLANYRISEQTRLAGIELRATNRQIAEDRAATAVLEAKWEQLAEPSRVQAMAQAKLGMNDGATLQLSALELLPRHEDAPLGNTEVQQASVDIPAPVSPKVVRVSDAIGK